MPFRSRRETPTSRSSRAICWETAAGLNINSVAAAENERWRATSRSTLSRRRSSIVASPGVIRGTRGDGSGTIHAQRGRVRRCTVRVAATIRNLPGMATLESSTPTDRVLDLVEERAEDVVAAVIASFRVELPGVLSVEPGKEHPGAVEAVSAHTREHVHAC